MRFYDTLASLLEHRRYRILAAVLVVLVPLLGLAPYLRSMVSRNAVVTAFTYTARAPISGRLIRVPSRGGEIIANGKNAAVVEDPRADDELVTELRSRNDAQRDLLTALDAQRELLHDLEARQSEKQRAYRAALDQDTEDVIETIRLDLEGSEALLVELRNDAARAKQLHADGVIPTSVLESETSAYETLEKKRAAQEAEIERLRTHRREIADGRLLANVIDGAVQVDESIERLRLELLSIERARLQAAADLDSMTERLGRAETRFENVQRAPVEVPDGVMVWQVALMEGQFVEAGAPVFTFVDCRSLLLDMRLDDSVLGLVDAGDEMRFRLFGSLDWHDAAVAMVRGSGAVMGPESLATVTSRNLRDGQVLARIPPGALAEDADGFCGIGRRSFAKLRGIGLFHEFARRLFL